MIGLDLWFREDVVRILASTHETMRSSAGILPAANPELADVYAQGFVDALRAVGIAFGVAAPAASGRSRPAPRPRQERISGPVDWKER